MKKLNLILASVSALFGLLVALAPYTFAKVCSMPKMHCHAVTAPTEFVLGILIFAFSAFQAALLWKKR
ncbi:DUF4418 family protein [uncultured Treponema sp.]|uniref:DUF4418 family protein n=1 Tax=uncultured Treponema sp. TaxID=162155 RepID=UPI0025D65F86|nr:DUF4418 family protein [uncultured Treponema sp.]